MKSLYDYINEQLLLEYIISKSDYMKIKYDLTYHSDERQWRDSFISKQDIINSLFKVSKDIKEDYEVNIIKDKDIVKIVDKSRKKQFNCIVQINKDKDYIILTVITHMNKNNYKEYDTVKTYITYLNDSSLKNNPKVRNNI